MKSEQEKHLEALNKAREFKNAFDDLTPESKNRLMQDLLGVATLQEAICIMQRMMQANGMR